jgi:hypothetical protein
MTQEQIQVRAKQSFYHDLVGSKAHGEVFQVSDQTTLQALEQLGYVETLQADASTQQAQQQQEAQQRAQQMGQQQAQANEAISQARHMQNMQANQHTQQVNQEAQQRAQQNGPNYQTEADKLATEQQQKQFNPSAVSPKATAKKANEKQ